MSTSTLSIGTRFFVTVFPATAGDLWVGSFQERRWENDATRKPTVKKRSHGSWTRFVGAFLKRLFNGHGGDRFIHPRGFNFSASQASRTEMLAFIRFRHSVEKPGHPRR